MREKANQIQIHWRVANGENTTLIMDILDPLHLQKLPQRTSRNWSDDIKRRAIAAYSSGTRITDISRKLNVPRRTLRHWITNNEDRRNRDDRLRLTEQQEGELFERMQRLSELCHYNLSKDNLQKIVYDYCLEKRITNYNFINGRAPLKWLNSFLFRNKHLGEVYFEKLNGDDVMLVTDYEDENVNSNLNDVKLEDDMNGMNEENSLSNEKSEFINEEDDNQPYYDYNNEVPEFYKEEPLTILSPIQELQLVNRIQNVSINGVLTKRSLIELTRNFFKENNVIFMQENDKAEMWVDDFMERYKTELGQYSDNEEMASISDDEVSSLSHHSNSNSLTESNRNSPIYTLKRLHKKRISSWDESHMKRALEELKMGGRVLPTARKYNIPRQTLSYRWEKDQKGETVIGMSNTNNNTSISTNINNLNQSNSDSRRNSYSIPCETIELPGPGVSFDFNKLSNGRFTDDSNSQTETSIFKSDITNSSSINESMNENSTDVIDILDSSDEENDDVGDDSKIATNEKNIKRQVNRWDHDTKVHVIRCLKSGESLKDVSEKFNIPGGTIRTWEKEYAIVASKPVVPLNITPPTNRIGMPVLSHQQETELIQRVKRKHNGQFNMTKQEFLKYVYDYCEENKIKHPFKNGQPGRKWYINFKTRHPEVVFKSSYTPNELTAYYEHLYNDSEGNDSSSQGFNDPLYEQIQ